MNDKELFALFLTHLLPGLRTRTALPNLVLARSYQATQQGTVTAPTVYFFKVGDRRHGHVERAQQYNANTGLFDTAERQVYESTLQFTAWAQENTNSVTSLTNSDILNAAASIAQSDDFIASLRAACVGILRVTEVRNPYVFNEQSRFEAVPSFDLVLTYERSYSATTPRVDTFETDIKRV